ncbi:hypothetical protein BJ138DRAFT_1067025 [Hygrophoropsis aurantiaca]|uniref:Uncharacterized protein n=1 Tax=Hygrophoropsis aurantiaca TaxID=72124 RepID=A0ACB8A8Q2_9AGAM|nr:hypothetical protein BJ138DRAFT_1067025 [Hygrophoropsis aurantiaca]
MAGPLQTHAPSYISSRSADVILSDIRPTKLTSEALHFINALLDEFLYSVLSAAQALATPRIRNGLHKVLPTTLGKEAILEAEMELRAYWERNGGVSGSASLQGTNDDANFHLQWAYELLRLKCEAYSTLSDTDEDSDIETQLYEQMRADGSPPPKQPLLAPAALYLTAILESVCEHVLSNVGRVAARDSSRATATTHDLFVALCEDSAIYGLFKDMKVYSQIEAISKLPKTRRSKSTSHDKVPAILSMSLSGSRDSGASRQEGSLNGSRTRISSESSSTGPTIVAGSNNHSSRSSFEKARAIKLFATNGRLSQEQTNGHELHNSHKKTESIASATAKQSLYSLGDRSPVSPTFSNDDCRSQEFDDMMRSGSTMKVSLTPDRLRTMEVFNKEKARSMGRQKGSLQAKETDGDGIPPVPLMADPPKRATRPTLRHVDSIIEDEDLENQLLPTKPPPPSRPRQLSAAAASANSAPTSNRVRSASASNISATKSANFSSKRPTVVDTSSFPQPPSSIANTVQKRGQPEHSPNMDTYRPPRTRAVIRNRESLDLDDIMGTSDTEEVENNPKPQPQQHNRKRGVSTGARELIDFLAEGPPEPPAKLTSNESSASLGTPKKAGRLQRMISRITLSGTDKVRAEGELGRSSSRRGGNLSPQDTPPTPFSPNKSLTNLSPLANRPVPPRYPISSSSSDSRSSIEKLPTSAPRSRITSFSRKPVPAWNTPSPSPEPPIPVPTTVESNISSVSIPQSNGESSHQFTSQDALLQAASISAVTSRGTVAETPASGSPVVQRDTVFTPVPVPHRTSSKTVATPPKPVTNGHSSLSSSIAIAEHAQDMRRLLSHATSADECRLLVDIFMTRARLAQSSESTQTSPQLSPDSHLSSNSGIETTVVELFLGGNQPGLTPETEPSQLEGLDVQPHAPATPLNGTILSTDMI